MYSAKNSSPSRKKAEELLTKVLESNEELRVESEYLGGLFESIPEAIVIVDKNGIIFRANPEFSRLFGYSHDEIIGRRIDDIVAPQKNHKSAENYTKEIKQGNKIEKETVYLHKDGTPLHVTFLAAPLIIDGEKLGGFLVYRNISDRKKSEALLMVEKEKFDILFNNVSDAVYLTDKEDRILRVNKAFLDLFGYKNKDVIGIKSKKVLLPEGQRTSLSGGIHPPSEKEEVETVIETRDGSPIPVSLLRIPISVNDELLAVYTLIRDISGQTSLEQELIAHREQMKEADTELKKFIASVSKGLKEPVFNAKQLASHLSQTCSSRLDDENMKNMDKLIRQINHLETLIDGILEATGENGDETEGKTISQEKTPKNEIEQTEEESLELNLLVQDVIGFLLPPENIDIKIKTTLPIITGRHDQIEKIFHVLIANSAQRVEDKGGQICIDCRKRSGFWEFSVFDDGPAFEDKPPVRSNGQETGIPSAEVHSNLSLAKHIVESLGGKLWVESGQGKGTTFTFTLRNS